MESFLFIFKQLMEGFQNPFKKSFQYHLHSFPNPPVSILVKIDFKPIYFGIHQIFPREEEVHFLTAFLLVSEDWSDQ
jgi:hypothetical protein